MDSQALDLPIGALLGASAGTTGSLVKQELARSLRDLILRGVIAPGARIVEGKWAAKLGVAQASIREALNILATEGFVEKNSGRSARVVHLSGEDIRQIYQLRGALEGLAARLATERRVPLDPLDEAVATMTQAARQSDVDQLVQADLRFHLSLAELSGNRYVLEQARRAIVPLFAFVYIVRNRLHASELWSKALPLHAEIVQIMRRGNAFLAEQFVVHAMREFERDAGLVWEGRSAESDAEEVDSEDEALD
jgi:DNA-binding GntR family transcriptional regulator